MSFLMMIHVVTGTVGVLSGAVALFARKGATVHRGAGVVFFVTMLISAGVGAVIALMMPEMITMLAGVFTCYLVTSSWWTARHGDARTDFATAAMAAVGLAVAAGGMVFGLEAVSAPDGTKDGYGPEPYFVFAGLALLAAGLDGSVLIRRGIGGAQRIARHVWRMCLALFIAAGSLFTGPGATAFPEAWQGSPLLSVPELIVLVMMVFWLVRVLFTGWWAKAT